MNGFCNKWRETKIGRVETLILTALMIGLFLGSVGFFFGKTCSSLPMMIGFFCALLGACLDSWQQALKFIVTVLMIFVMTVFTFSYVGTDATTCHYPMQRLLIDGWNPIFQSSCERFNEIPKEGRIAMYHILFMPKITALCGALIASATNLFSGDAFLGYALIVSLWCVSCRFARSYWNCSLWAGCVFAFTVTFSTKITSFLAGQVDYTVYASFMIGLFAFLTWIRGRIVGDLYLAFLGLAIAMLAKPAGSASGVLALLIGGFMTRFDAFFIKGFRIFLAFFIIVGATPFLTAWIQYGSPFYPAMTFDPTVQTIDITSDFVCNADGEYMGYFSRIVYAWFSKALAIKWCAWLSGKTDFSPEFYVCAGVGGLGAWFSLLLSGSIIALAFARKNIVFYLCLFLFFTANFAPLKYIGYSRYFSQIWVIPFLAVFNLIYAPYEWLEPYIRRARVFVLIGCVLFMMPFFARTIAYQGMQLRLEWERQKRFAEMREISSEWYSSEELRYTDIKRLNAAGISISKNRDVPMLIYNQQFLMPFDDLAVTKKFVICDSIQSLFRFPWVDAYTHIPCFLTRQP